MEWFRTLLDRIAEHDVLLWWLFVTSVAVFLVTPIAVVWVAARLPSDYFVRPRRRSHGWWERQPPLRIAFLVAKNVVAGLLLAAGLVMLVAPGQGLSTIAVGVILLDFPGKFRVERWLVTRKPVWRSINWLRRRAGRAPLEPPH